MMKVCSHCKQEKPVEEFFRSRCTPDGLRYDCKSCSHERNVTNYQKHADERRRRAREYGAEHRDEQHARNRSYHEAHAEELREKARNERASMTQEELEQVNSTVRERRKELGAEWRDKQNDYQRRYRLEHMDDMRRYLSVRRRSEPFRITAIQMVSAAQFRCRKSGVIIDPGFMNRRTIEELLRQSPKCAMCGVPLDYGPKGSRRGGGVRDNSPSLDRFVPELGYREGNVGVLCHLCNQRKNNHTLDSALLLVEYLTRRAPSIGRRVA